VRKKKLPYNGYLFLYTIILLRQCTWIIGSFPLYVYHFLHFIGHPLFWGTSVMPTLPLARWAAIGQKNRKYPSTCHVTPPQVDHRVTAVYPLLIRILYVYHYLNWKVVIKLRSLLRVDIWRLLPCDQLQVVFYSKLRDIFDFFVNRIKIKQNCSIINYYI